jgi:hypothetical protein
LESIPGPLGSLKFGLRDESKDGSGSRWSIETIREEGIIESRKAKWLWRQKGR